MYGRLLSYPFPWRPTFENQTIVHPPEVMGFVDGGGGGWWWGRVCGWRGEVYGWVGQFSLEKSLPSFHSNETGSDIYIQKILYGLQVHIFMEK